MARAILRALLLGAAIAACVAQVPPATWNCPTNSSLLFSNVRQSPATIDCSTATQYGLFEYWTPPLDQGAGQVFNPAALNPTNPAVASSSGTASPLLTGGALATTVNPNVLEFGPFPNAANPPSVNLGQRSCGSTPAPPGATGGWVFPAAAYASYFNTIALPTQSPIISMGLCCQACSSDPNCRAWRYIAVPTVAGSPSYPPTASDDLCQLYNSVETARTAAVVDVTDFGYSAGWGTLRVTLTPLAPATQLPTNLASVFANLTASYTRICATGVNVNVGPISGSDTQDFSAIANAPVAAITTVTPNGVCGNATVVTGTFVYTGANTAGTSNFTVLVDGATCSPGASSVAGNSTGTTVSFNCTGLPALSIGTHNVSVTATYSGAGGGRCTGGTTSVATNNFTASAAPAATLAASSTAPVCAGNQAIVATFAYAPSAGVAPGATFAPTITPGIAGTVCTAAPSTASANATITVTCQAPFPGFPASTQTIGLTATYTGVAPCNTTAQTVSASTNVTVAAGSSGVTLTPIATSSVCSPVNSVGATWTYTATNVNTTTFTATSPGLTCSPTPATVPGSTGAIQPVNVSVTCTNAGGALVPAGSVPISLSAAYTGNGPCPPGSMNGTSTVTVLPQPTGSLAPRPNSSPVNTCFGSRAFGATFAATLANGATSWTATSATLANLFTCSVTQTGSASGDTAAVVCNTTSPGFPTGTHTLQVQGTFAASAPCSGGPLTNGTTQVIVAAAPVVTVTPRPIAVPGCNGAASVFADFDYIISGAGATPALTVSVPAGCTFTVPTAGTTGTIRVTCTGPFTADVPINLTISATENADLCGSASGAGSTTVPILCCSPAGTTTYAKLNNSDYNPPQCWRHQKPGNSQWNSCPFAYGWMNQGLTDDNVPSTVEAVDTADPTCSSAGAIGTVTAKCVTLDGITGVGANGRAGNLLRITVSNFFFSSVPTMRVYAMCQPPRNRTCYASSGSLWRNPFTWPRYRPVTRDVVDAGGETKTTTFTIPMATYFAAPSGGCTCDTIYWFIEQVGQYRYRPAAGATCPWTLP